MIEKVLNISMKLVKKKIFIKENTLFLFVVIRDKNELLGKYWNVKFSLVCVFKYSDRTR